MALVVDILAQDIKADRLVFAHFVICGTIKSSGCHLCLLVGKQSSSGVAPGNDEEEEKLEELISDQVEVEALKRRKRSIQLAL